MQYSKCHEPITLWYSITSQKTRILLEPQMSQLCNVWMSVLPVSLWILDYTSSSVWGLYTLCSSTRPHPKHLHTMFMLYLNTKRTEVYLVNSSLCTWIRHTRRSLLSNFFRQVRWTLINILKLWTGWFGTRFPAWQDIFLFSETLRPAVALTHPPILSFPSGKAAGANIRPFTSR